MLVQHGQRSKSLRKTTLLLTVEIIVAAYNTLHRDHSIGGLALDGGLDRGRWRQGEMETDED